MGKTLIRGGLVIDGTGGSTIDKGAILIDGSRIIKVGSKEEFWEDDGIHVLDCSDQTLLPGLIGLPQSPFFRSKAGELSASNG